MWVLLTITLIDGGAQPSRFETTKYTSQQLCIQAQQRAELRQTTFAYCSFEPKK